MGKKIPILISTLTLLGGFAVSKNVFADNSGPWTFEEMKALNQEVEAIKDEQCSNPDYGDPFMCYMEFRWDDIDVDIRLDLGLNRQKYETLESFNYSALTITAINPSKNTIRVYFSSENVEDKHMGARNYISDLDELYIGQFDRGYLNDVGYFVRNGVANPNLHLLFAGSQAMNGEGWFPSDTEVELAIDGFSLSNDREQQLSVSYVNTRNGSYGIFINYASCVDSPDYQEGMECQVRYSGPDLPFYVPVIPYEEPAPDTNDPATDNTDPTANGTTTDNPAADDPAADGSTTNGTTTDDPAANDTTTDNPTLDGDSTTPDDQTTSGNQAPSDGPTTPDDQGVSDNPTTSDDQTPDDQTMPDNNQTTPTDQSAPNEQASTDEPVQKDEGYGSTSDAAVASSASTATVKTPDTGVATEECTKSVEFPWWLIVLIVLGDAAVIWWFIPARKRE